ncbi:MAG TPA: hypothetical protein VG146_01780 [Verrucomicrobiae bacterium]|nr:hypothetical protein [Verrucomicrobiae bacterium]
MSLYCNGIYITNNPTWAVQIFNTGDTTPPRFKIASNGSASQHFWQFQKDLESNGSQFEFYSSTNGGSNVNLTLTLDPFSGNENLVFGKYVGNLAGATNVSSTVLASSADVALKGFEEYVFLAGNHTCTLGSAATNAGHSVSITCTSAGTNAILPILSQTITGASKWTNGAIYTVTKLISDGSNWQIAGSRGN